MKTVHLLTGLFKENSAASFPPPLTPHPTFLPLLNISCMNNPMEAKKASLPPTGDPVRLAEVGRGGGGEG